MQAVADWTGGRGRRWWRAARGFAWNLVSQVAQRDASSFKQYTVAVAWAHMAHVVMIGDYKQRSGEGHQQADFRPRKYAERLSKVTETGLELHRAVPTL